MVVGVVVTTVVGGVWVVVEVVAAVLTAKTSKEITSKDLESE